MLSKFLEYAEEYIPEWKPDLENPDIGTVIALIFCGQMEEAGELRTQLVKNSAGKILNLRKRQERPAAPAAAVLVMEPDKTAVNGVELPKGSLFQGQADDGGPPVIFRTVYELTAGTANLSAVLGISASKKKIISYGPEFPDNGLPLFSFSGDNLYTEEIRLEHPLLKAGELSIPRPRGCSQMELDDARLRMGGAGLKPTLIYDGERALAPECAEIFGREILPYKECLLGQEDAFLKPGAEIVCTFELEWKEESAGEEKKQEELRAVVRYKKEEEPVRHHVYPEQIDISYYNGKGYKSLPVRDSGNLSPGSGAGKRACAVKFICPADWEEQEAGGCELRFIRLRVLEAKNCYMPGAVHHFPVIKNMRFSWTFGKAGVRPRAVYRRQGSRSVLVSGAGQTRENGGDGRLFAEFPYSGESMLFGFDRVFPSGGSGIYMRLGGPGALPGRKLAFSCSSEEGFAPLRAEDGTNGLSRSGILRFHIPESAGMQEIEGKKCFWIKVEQKETAPGTPRLMELFLNAAEAENIEISPWRPYVQEEVEAQKTAPIPGACILDAQVWVNEQNSLTELEKSSMLRQEPERVEIEKDARGRTTAFYVQWHEYTGRASGAGRKKDDGRYYMLDRTGKTISFGKDKSWKIPRETQETAWRLRTVSCQGARGNLAAGRITETVKTFPALKKVYNPESASGGREIQTDREGRGQAASFFPSGGQMATESDIIRLAGQFSDSIVQALPETDGQGNLTVTLFTKQREDYPKLCKALRKFLLEKLPVAGRWTDVLVCEAVYTEVSVSVWLSAPGEDNSGVKRAVEDRLYAYFQDVRGQGDKDAAGGTGYDGRMGKLPSHREIEELLWDAAGERAVVQRFGVVLAFADGTGRREEELTEHTTVKNAVCVNGKHRVFIQGWQDWPK